MLSLKKVYRDELLQLALILSLLRVRPESYIENDLYSEVNNLDLENGTSWRFLNPSLLRSHYVHPKNFDSVLLNYEREVFADLNSLGRYNRGNINSDVTAYLLNIERTASSSNVLEVSGELGPAPQNQSTENDRAENVANTEEVDNSLGLSQEDMDLIEILWKQDVDLGFSMDVAADSPDAKSEHSEKSSLPAPTTSIVITDDDVEKLKTLKAVNDDSIKVESENTTEELDPWAGFEYTIDTETGEYVIKSELENPLPGVECSPSCDLPLGDLPEFLLEEALHLVGLDDDIPQETLPLSSDADTDSAVVTPNTGSEDRGTPAKELDSEEELELLADMIQTSQFHHPHHRAFQSRMPFVRTMSMEQRWEDLANLLRFPNPGDSAGGMPHPFSHHHHPLHNYSHPHPHPHSMGYVPDSSRGVLLHNATLTPPVGDINGTVPYGNIGGTNLGNAVATSMNLTNSSEPMAETTTAPHYKLEPSHEMMYYHNGSSELNQTDGFLSSIFDEDLQLMDMGINQTEGMYTMRMLDGNNAVSNLSMNGTGVTNVTRADVERMDTSSDSAVSSMGSERVPSLSDSEWCDAGSDSGHTAGDHYVSDYTKYRPYDYSYNSRQHSSATDSTRLQPVAQKKHHMFGKRCFQEQGATVVTTHQPQSSVKYEYRDQSSTPVFNSPSQADVPKPPELKYSCSMEFGRHLSRNSVEQVQHNHTYHLPAESTGAMQKPLLRDKSKGRKSEEEHLTRDEKRARALNVPITVDDIINLPMDEFNERLSKYDLSEAQLSLIRDIRRRGKNKVAAQNCRKRKLDQILSLADEVKDMRDRKMRLLNEHEYMLNESQRVKDKYQQLYRHVFQNLRDADGNHYSPYQYSLQTSADGSILIVPRSNSTLTNPVRKDQPPKGSKE